jgi:hypothetical protein
MDQIRGNLVTAHGVKKVEAAEKNVKKILDDPDNDLFIRVEKTATLEKIINSRFLPHAELNAMGLGRGQPYQDKRDRVERRVMGYPPTGVKNEDRPIYAYLAGQDTSKGSHVDVDFADYGNITVKLKSEVKSRSTFTGSDSFKSGAASEMVNPGNPPPPSAASLVSATFHGFERGKIPSAYAASNPSYDQTDDGTRLTASAKAKDVQSLAQALAPHGNAYVEAQVHGQVRGTDIAELHFRPKNSDGSDDVSPQVARWAYDNKVKLFVRGKEVDLDAQFKTTAEAIKSAIASGDIATVLSSTGKLAIASKTYNKPMANPGDQILGTLFDETGYSGKPTVGTSASVTTAWRNGGTMMLRGCDPVNGIRAKALKDFQSGDYFVGNGAYGNGTYVAHGGSYKAGKFIPYDAKRADFDAQDAVGVLRDNVYSTATGVTLRMALPSDAKIITQKDLIQQAKAIDAQIKKYHKTETAKLIKGGKPATADLLTYQAEETRLTNYFSQNYGLTKYPPAGTTSVTVPLPGGGSKQLNQTTYNIVMVEKAGLGIGDPNPLAGYTMRSQPDASDTGKNYEVLDPGGNRIPAASSGTAPSYIHANRKDVAIAAAKHMIERQALKNLGLAAIPGDTVASPSGAASGATLADKINQLDKEVATARDTLFGDTQGAGGYHYSSGRLATILGYDAIAIEDGWGKGSKGDSRFMNLLNRSKVIIQNDELNYNTAIADVIK